MAGPLKIQVRFWGVRGSIPTPVAHNLGHGGNTACIEVRYGGERPLIFDAGTGAPRLFAALLEEAGGQPFSANIFLTHFHWDHIQGVPFMPALYSASSQLTFYSDRPADTLSDTLKGQMSSPTFPCTCRKCARKSAIARLSREDLSSAASPLSRFRCITLTEPWATASAHRGNASSTPAITSTVTLNTTAGCWRTPRERTC